MSTGTLEKDIEKATIDLFRAIGWSTANVMEEQFGPGGTLGRDDRSQVVLLRRLRPALRKLNPHATNAAIEQTIEDLCRDRSAMSLVQANREIHKNLVGGFAPTSAAASVEGDEHPRVRIIDWDHPETNDFFLAQQFWIQGPLYKRRADLIGFVNGLPLVFIELKGLDKPVKNAYDENLTDYKIAVPQIFWHNAIVVLSNGFESRIGSISAGFEHFAGWKRIEREKETPRVSLEVMIRGVCDKARLLDLVENFTLYSNQRSETQKIIGQNHQFLGVNNALAAVQQYQLAEGADVTDRSDIIVIADEAHRTQYDTFALNLRNALPNAAFIGFTGTPLLAGEEKTRARRRAA